MTAEQRASLCFAIGIASGVLSDAGNLSELRAMMLKNELNPDYTKYLRNKLTEALRGVTEP